MDGTNDGRDLAVLKIVIGSKSLFIRGSEALVSESRDHFLERFTDVTLVPSEEERPEPRVEPPVIQVEVVTEGGLRIGELFSVAKNQEESCLVAALWLQGETPNASWSPSKLAEAVKVFTDRQMSNPSQPLTKLADKNLVKKVGKSDYELAYPEAHRALGVLVHRATSALPRPTSREPMLPTHPAGR